MRLALGSAGGEHSGRGLIVRANYLVSLEAPSAAAAVWRPAMDRLYNAPVPYFSPISSQQAAAARAADEAAAAVPLSVASRWASSGRARYGVDAAAADAAAAWAGSEIAQHGADAISYLSKPLPPNVQIVTLRTLQPGKVRTSAFGGPCATAPVASSSPSSLSFRPAHAQVLLRLGHQFGLGEDGALSQPLSIDLATLFALDALPIAAAIEMTLTANQEKAELQRRRQAKSAWRIEGEPDGPPEAHDWRRTAPLDWSKSTVITLGPLEIKTFVLTLA